MENPIKQFNEMMKHPLHCHPNMEEKLGVDEDHVIVDKKAWWRYLQCQQHRPTEEVAWWVQSMN